MKHLLIFCAFIICITTSSAQIPDYGYDKVRIVRSEMVIVFETLRVGKHPTPLSDKNYFWYSANSIQTTQGGYSGKLLNGTYAEYYLNKNIRTLGAFKQGLKEGEWSSWDNMGHLVEKTTWSKGTKEGAYQLYDSLGFRVEEGRFQKGLKHGMVRNIFPNDSVKIAYFVNGVETEKSKSFFKRLISLLPKRDSSANDKTKKTP